MRTTRKLGTISSLARGCGGMGSAGEMIGLKPQFAARLQLYR